MSRDIGGDGIHQRDVVFLNGNRPVELIAGRTSCDGCIFSGAHRHTDVTLERIHHLFCETLPSVVSGRLPGCEKKIFQWLR